MSGICCKQGSIYLLLVLFLSAISCKTRHVDSEPTFVVSFIKPDIFKIKKYCFKNIYGKAHANFGNTCIDTVNNSFTFPINIHEKSSEYVFEESKSSDTLEIRYEVEIGKGDYEFKAVIKNFSIGHTTFDSVSIEPKVNPNSYEVENITVYL